MDQTAYSNAVFYMAGLDQRYRINRNVGWIYAAHNSALPGSVLKIGMSARPPERRATELARATGYEGQFRLIYFVHVSERCEAEKWVHRTLDRYRVRSWEEFFALPLRLALDAMDEVARMFPLTSGRPGRFLSREKPKPLPQPFRKFIVD